MVAQGFSQRPGEDYNETFAPVARFGSIRTLLAYSVYRNMKVHQMDVKTAFLNGCLDEDIYLHETARGVRDAWQRRLGVSFEKVTLWPQAVTSLLVYGAVGAPHESRFYP